MLTKNVHSSLILSFIMVAIFCLGCASQKALLNTGYNLKEQENSHLKIHVTTLQQEGDQLVIAGEITRKHKFRSLPGHVDIIIYNQNGEMLKKVVVENKLPFIGRSKRTKSKFKTSIPIIPPEGSTIEVNFHKN